MGKSLQLKVAEAVQDDVNKGIVRIDASLMRDIGIRPGDVVEISGDKKTVAIAERAYPGDIGLNIIRMDGLLRRNAKTGIGEEVTISAVEVKEAKKVTLAPARKDVVIKADASFFKRGLMGRAVVKGDIISMGGQSRRRPPKQSPSYFFDDFVELFDEGFGSGISGFGFSDLKFVVVETQPKQPVKITDLTEIVYNPEAGEGEEEESSYPDVTYEDIGGLQDEVKKIREMVEIPMKHPEVFDRLGIEAPKGVLVHGSPGTGKTLLAKAVANETNAHFININGPEIMSKFYGQSEENLRKKFEEAEKNAPAIIFIDEIDAIASKREEAHGDVEKRVVAQLLAVMDGLKSRGKVVVIAATNIPNSIDPALRRPGRFDREIEIGVPKEVDRLEVLKVHTRNMPLSPPFDTVIVRESIEEYNAKLHHDKEVLEKELRSFKKDISEKKEQVKKIDKQFEGNEDDSSSRHQSLKKQRENLHDQIERLEERERQKKSDLERAEKKIGELDSIRERLEETINSDEPERGLFGLSYVDLKALNDSATRYIISQIKKKLDDADRPMIEHLDEIKNVRDIRDKVLEHLDQEDPRRSLVEEAVEEMNIDLDSFTFSKSGLKSIIPDIEDKALAPYLEAVEKKAKDDDEVNSIISANWINSDLKEKIRTNLVRDMLSWVSKVTHGFVGADLASLTKESAMIVLRRITSDLKDSEKGDISKYLDKLNISVDDFKEALKTVRPSALREVLVEVPKLKWGDVGGLDSTKQELVEAVEWPLKKPGIYERMGVSAPKGVLLYGPPGTGKTMLAKAAANESQSNFILVKGPEMLSKWVGESEKAVRKIFEKARQTSPVIIFLDELDSIAPRRGAASDTSVTERVVNQLLTEMDGLIDLNDVVIIGATNRPDIVDTALLRPGRFDRIILVPAPDQQELEDIFRVHTQGMPLGNKVSYKELAKRADGYAGADIQSLCREAAIFALREDENATQVTTKHFDMAFKKVPPSVTKEIKETYEKLQSSFSSQKGREMTKEKPTYFG